MADRGSFQGRAAEEPDSVIRDGGRAGRPAEPVRPWAPVAAAGCRAGGKVRIRLSLSLLFVLLFLLLFLSTLSTLSTLFVKGPPTHRGNTPRTAAPS